MMVSPASNNGAQVHSQNESMSNEREQTRLALRFEV